MAENEHARRAELNANRNRVEARLQKRNYKPQAINAELSDDEAQDSANREYAHKSSLALLKSAAHNGIVKTTNKQAGQFAGEIAGGWVGSIIPFIGTAAGALLEGRRESAGLLLSV